MANHLYLHVPFCKTICAYCDFCHVVFNENVADKWLDELSNEIKTHDLSNLATIYIGGGTPTSLNLKELNRLLELIKPYSNNVIEYTIEINPETFDADKALLLKKYGINRASIGLQSTNIKELTLMNRKHSLNDVKNTVDLLSSVGIDNYSLDIMYSLPFQTMDSLKKTIDDALSLKPKHLSLYSLTIEDNTVFGKKGIKNLDEDTEADMYEFISKYLSDCGFVHYEVSNFAYEGYESKHNMAYWKYDDFIGLSLGASGKENHVRYDKTRNMKQYLNHDYYAEKIELTLEDEMFENVMMSLRTIYGLDLNSFKERYKLDFFEVYSDAYNKHKDCFVLCDNHLIVNDLGVLNTVLIDFLD